MNYQFDNDFQTAEIPIVDPETENFQAQKAHQEDTGPETWKYGEGQYDYLAENSGYGYHGSPKKQSGYSQRSPWVHYYVIDNIKYFVVMFIFYFLFTTKLESLGFSEVRYMEVRDEMLAVYFALFSLLFFKSTWRLIRMR